jgi:toluene methyl-monooxygenase
MGSATGYLRYYLGNVFTLLGVVGFAVGGSWVWLGAATFPLLVALDLLFLRPDLSERNLRHPRLADLPLYLHLPLMVALLVLAARRIGLIAASDAPAPGQLAGCVLGLAWLGTLPNGPIAHELFHRRGPLPRFLGHVLTVAVADPVRRLAHLRGHHVQFGEDTDPDTARRGETFYAFVLRVAVASSVEGYRSERRRLALAGRSLAHWRGDPARSVALVLATLAGLYALGGWAAAGLMALAFVLSRLLLEGFNYFQHYGLVRVPGSRHDTRHTWSHLSPVVRTISFEITNHAHHHMDQGVPFHQLRPDPQAPQMPSIVLCFLAALVPPIWFRFIAMPHLRRWDLSFATPEERVLAAKANAAAGWPAWLSD